MAEQHKSDDVASGGLPQRFELGQEEWPGIIEMRNAAFEMFTWLNRLMSTVDAGGKVRWEPVLKPKGDAGEPIDVGIKQAKLMWPRHNEDYEGVDVIGAMRNSIARLNAASSFLMLYLKELSVDLWAAKTVMKPWAVMNIESHMQIENVVTEAADKMLHNLIIKHGEGLGRKYHPSIFADFDQDGAYNETLRSEPAQGVQEQTKEEWKQERVGEWPVEQDKSEGGIGCWKPVEDGPEDGATHG